MQTPASGRVLAVLQARMSSTRLPGKVLQPIEGQPMLARQIERIRRSAMIDELVVATSTDESDDPLAALCEGIGVPVARGSLHDVLDRFHAALEAFPAEHVVRLTADCPLTSPRVIDEVIRLHLTEGADYTSNCHPPTFPDGLDVEVLTEAALRWAHDSAGSVPEREHVTLAIYNRPESFRLANLEMSPDLSALRWTVDLPADLEFARSVYAALVEQDPSFELEDILAAIHAGLIPSHTDKVMERNESLIRQLSEGT